MVPCGTTKVLYLLGPPHDIPFLRNEDETAGPTYHYDTSASHHGSLERLTGGVESK